MFIEDTADPAVTDPTEVDAAVELATDDGAAETAGSVIVRRRGAPRGNVNSLRHGLRSSADAMDFRLALGKFPEGYRSIENQINGFRRVVEQATTDAHGSIGVYHAALIQSACRYETHAMLARRWLMDNLDAGLKADQKLAYSKAIAEASAARDRCLRELGLDKKPSDAWADLSASLAIDATGSGPGDQATDAATAIATPEQPEQPTDA